MPEEIKKSITIFKTPSWGILGTAFLIMLGAKCFGYAPDLSWWVVTLPLWGIWALALSFLVFWYAALFLCLGVICIVGAVLGVGYAIYDFFKEIFTRKGKDNDDDEYKLYG